MIKTQTIHYSTDLDSVLRRFDNKSQNQREYIQNIGYDWTLRGITIIRMARLIYLRPRNTFTFYNEKAPDKPQCSFFGILRERTPGTTLTGAFLPPLLKTILALPFSLFLILCAFLTIWSFIRVLTQGSFDLSTFISALLASAVLFLFHYLLFSVRWDHREEAVLRNYLESTVRDSKEAD